MADSQKPYTKWEKSNKNGYTLYNFIYYDTVKKDKTTGAENRSKAARDRGRRAGKDCKAV